MSTSLNESSMAIVRELMDRQEDYQCSVIEQENGVTLIDTGIETEGSIEAGRLVSEICLGGLGAVRVTEMHISDMTLPAVVVSTWKPALSTLASQKAGWYIKVGTYSAMGSGPARAMAAKETNLYEELQYRDQPGQAVILLETRVPPPVPVTDFIAQQCGIAPSELYCIVAPTASIVGSVQVAARVVEVGVFRLHRLGLDPYKIRSGHGVAPIAPVASKDSKAMGLTNDCILYGGRTFFFVRPDECDDLELLVKQAPSSCSPQYGEPFYYLFKSVSYDFYQVDQDLFGPAEITITDVVNNVVHKAGQLNPEVLKRSLKNL